MGFTPCKAEQPWQSKEVQEKEEEKEKDEKHLEKPFSKRQR